MKELTDYSGDFIPDIKFQDFSKDALLKLLAAACRDYIGIDNIWLNTISYFHPKIKMRPLKLPPRQSSDEIACRWEIKLEV